MQLLNCEKINLFVTLTVSNLLGGGGGGGGGRAGGRKHFFYTLTFAYSNSKTLILKDSSVRPIWT